ncbi:hypothetical protein J5N58_14125 [Rhizobium cremeum]|uniref:hypothetical protein n=1 Tax=Rhizobium cremeum TaxID=2813827 RepID=UPI000DDFE101|nr:hypothetical protein [Rhizobium cremeum]MCJ7995319.1 hypothetical protein [Rhizobium cremeum]MCJ8000818.1 hypothetical protein [Rhizobium cremeum]
MSPNIETFKPHGFTIFCEDLREELSGQTTYVGVYGDAMFTDEPLPFTLRQLCMAVHLFDEPQASPSKLIIKIAQPGEDIEKPTFSFEVTPNFELLDLPDIGDMPKRPRAHVVLKMVGTPPEIKQYGRIRVAADWNGNFVPLGSLAIAPLTDDVRNKK